VSVTAPWLGDGERILWSGRSSATGVPWQFLAAALGYALVAYLLARLTGAASTGTLIVIGVAFAAFLGTIAASTVRSRTLDRYVVTTGRALIVRGGTVVRQVPVTTPNLKFSMSRLGSVEWGKSRSSGVRVLAEVLGLADADMTFDHVEDIQSLSVVIRNARAALGVDTPELP